MIGIEAKKTEAIAEFIHGKDNVKLISIGNPCTYKVLVYTGNNSVKDVEYFNSKRGDSQELVDYFFKNGLNVSVSVNVVTVKNTLSGEEFFAKILQGNASAAISLMFINYFKVGKGE